HDSDRADRQKHREGLTGPVVQIVLAQLADENIIGPAQQVRKLLPDLAEDPNAKTRAWERMPVDHPPRQSQLDSEAAHFVLEQLAQRLEQLEFHPFGQPADVVM